MKKRDLLILILTIAVTLTSGLLSEPTPTYVIIRMDDASDYCKQTQIELINIHKKHSAPISIGIIPTYLTDQELITIYKETPQLVEYCQHGWEHENHTLYSYKQQEKRIIQGKTQIEKMFDTTVNVFIPPLYEYNQDTVEVLNDANFSLMSTYLDVQYLSDDFVDIPVTVQYSSFSNGQWVQRDLEDLFVDVRWSIENFGYVVIGTHPQEFMMEDQVDYQSLEIYEEFLIELLEDYQITQFNVLYNSK